jgi:hypothetical protein
VRNVAEDPVLEMMDDRCVVEDPELELILPR